MPEITPGTPLHSFVEAFCKATADALSQSLASPWTVRLDGEGATASPESSVFFHFATSGGLQGSAALQLPSAQALFVAQKILSESPEPSTELTPNHQASLEEIFRQMAALAMSELRNRFGEVALEMSSGEAPSWQGVTVSLLASDSSSANLQLQFLLSSELLASISSTAASTATSSAQNPAPSQGPNFDLLMGVNLNLTLRFGQRILTLRELLDLSSGAVIELDREVHEPADLLLGDKVIARGEVVIVDGNYGLRVTEVADARQRPERI